MARKRKLTPATVRKIFKSAETGKALSAQFGVSQHMIYLIRSGRAHQKTTSGLEASKRARGRKASRTPTAKIDVNALADALLDRIMARFFGR
jgi:hypothetical protein